MIGKSVYLLAFLASITVVTNAVPSPYFEHYAADKTNLSHHLIVGTRLIGDSLVLQQRVFKASSWWQIVTVEEELAVSKYKTITQVRALDQETNGNGATPSLLKGGPGVSNVTLRFKSTRGNDIDFKIEIYAR